MKAFEKAALGPLCFAWFDIVTGKALVPGTD
jgi:hypothetical protein